jgi:hypothetical protein
MRNTLKRIALGMGLAFIAGLCGSVGFASLAHADEGSFVRDMTAAGYSDVHGGTQAMIDVGHYICGELANGMTESQAAAQLYGEAQLTSMASAQEFVTITVKDLCPSLKG